MSSFVFRGIVDRVLFVTGFIAILFAPVATIRVQSSSSAVKPPSGSSFGVKTSLPQEELPVLLFAEMSALVYNYSDDLFEALQQDVAATGFSVAEWYDGQPSSLFTLLAFYPFFAVFTREAPHKQAVISLRGVTPKINHELWGAVVNAYLGASPDTARGLVETYVRKYEDLGYTVLITGHSLGGYMAEIVATTYNLPGMGFQSPGPRWHNGPFEPKFWNINEETDPIANFEAHNQWTIFTKFEESPGDSLAGHRINNMVLHFNGTYNTLTNGNMFQYVTKGDAAFYLGGEKNKLSRCCCKRSNVSECELLRGNALKKSWNLVKWGSYVCPKEYQRHAKFEAQELPAECAEAETRCCCRLADASTCKLLRGYDLKEDSRRGYVCPDNTHTYADLGMDRVPLKCARSLSETD